MSSAQYESREHNEVLERNALHHATLRLAGGRLPEGYLNEALRDRLRAYQADDEARERLAAHSHRLTTVAIEEAGDEAEARRRFEGNAGDGMLFALVRGLRSPGDIKAYRIGNPRFRERFDEDLAFQHGVEASVWANRE